MSEMQSQDDKCHLYLMRVFTTWYLIMPVYLELSEMMFFSEK